jgi:hypothetical protein
MGQNLIKLVEFDGFKIKEIHPSVCFNHSKKTNKFNSITLRFARALVKRLNEQPLLSKL